DLYNHVSHARMIALIEDARIPWRFEEGLPTATLVAAAAMTDLSAKSRDQIEDADGPIRVRMWGEEVGGALVVARRQGRGRPTADSEAAAVDCTATIAAFDLATQRPRRLTREERGYLLEFRHEDRT